MAENKVEVSKDLEKAGREKVLSPNKPPYSVLEEFGISSYQITDMSGNVVIKGADTTFSQISNGQAVKEASGKITEASFTVPKRIRAVLPLSTQHTVYTLIFK